MKSAPLAPALATAPLVVMCLALGLLALPLWDHAAPWAVVAFIGCLVTRLVLNRYLWPLPPAWLKLAVLTIGTGVILATYGTLVGVEAAFGILLLLIGLKVIETNHARDLQVLTLLGCFMGLCDLFFEQDFERWLYVGTAYTLVLAGRIYFYQPGAPKGLRRSLAQTLKLLLQAAPLTVLFFIFFPRFTGEFRFIFGGGLGGGTGLPTRLTPGSLASLALRSDTAFTVSFPDNTMPEPRDLYWRGLVLWDGMGLNWERGGPVRTGLVPRGLNGSPIRQHIMLEPYGDTWLFALDWPSGPVAGANYETGGIIRRQRPFYTRVAYDVESRPVNQQTFVWPDEMAAATRKEPIRVSAAVRKLAESWRSPSFGQSAESKADDETVIRRALLFFRRGGFTYSLTPGQYTSAELDEFLFQRRSGFCEHYAAAFASLMRLADIPSRVIVGYQGGEFNDIGQYLIVRQSDAHSWCEVYLKNRGWVRVDPTSVIAPDRVAVGLQSYLEGNSAAGARVAQLGNSTILRDLQRQARLYWANLSYQWNLRVLSFDRDSQRSFFARFGFVNFDDYNLATALMFGTVIVLGVLLVWLRRTPQAALGDAASRWYARYCQRLARAGLLRKPTEGPLDFAERAAGFVPAYAPLFREIGQLYAGLRYAPQPPLLPDLVRAIRRVPRRFPPVPSPAP